MRRPRRTLLLAMLAVLVPLPAFALDGETVPAPEPLSVEASLGTCGKISGEVACQVTVSWNTLATADSYSVDVSRPDGSAISFGSVVGGGTTIWVPYVGDGTYNVQVTAYGHPESNGDKGKVVARSDAAPTAADPAGQPRTAGETDGSEAAVDPAAPALAEPGPVEESAPAEEPAPVEEPEPAEEPEPEPEVEVPCEPEAAAAADPASGEPTAVEDAATPADECTAP